MNLTNNKSKESLFHRFQVFQAVTNEDGKLENRKTIGMAYLKDGQSLYTLRLWTFLNERFYILPTRNDPTKYLIMTREPNKNPNARSKYYWNIVGNGTANSAQGVITLGFDLFDKPVFLNMFPEHSAHSVSMSDPVELEELKAA